MNRAEPPSAPTSPQQNITPRKPSHTESQHKMQPHKATEQRNKPTKFHTHTHTHTHAHTHARAHITLYHMPTIKHAPWYLHDHHRHNRIHLTTTRHHHEFTRTEKNKPKNKQNSLKTTPRHATPLPTKSAQNTATRQRSMSYHLCNVHTTTYHSVIGNMHDQP